jgi:hypothetical protein
MQISCCYEQEIIGAKAAKENVQSVEAVLKQVFVWLIE